MELGKFGSRIKELRIKKGITQDELAKLMGYTSRSTINKIEKGLIDVNQSKLLDFAKVLNASPDYLLGLEEESKNDKNKIIILGRNGKREEFILTDEEIEAYEKIFKNRDKYRNDNNDDY